MVKYLLKFKKNTIINFCIIERGIPPVIDLLKNVGHMEHTFGQWFLSRKTLSAFNSNTMEKNKTSFKKPCEQCNQKCNVENKNKPKVEIKSDV